MFEARRWASSLMAAVLAAQLVPVFPARAFSRLAAWSITAKGELLLRTSPNLDLDAFFKDGDSRYGDRIWIDFPGSPQRPRKIPGKGAIREIRVGMPERGVTRLVIEFKRGVELDPSRLRLVGLDWDSWRMRFPLQDARFVAMGEGVLEREVAFPRAPTRPGRSRAPLRTLTVASLPWVRRGAYRVMLDPGHGGKDPGAIGIGGTREKDVVLDVSRQVASHLRRKGVVVKMTRSSDTTVDLPPRARLSNRWRPDAFVSIHANAISMRRPEVNGLETFYFQSFQGKKLSSLIHDSILRTVRRKDRGVKEARFYVIRRTNSPASLVELGFLTGTADAADLADPAHRRQLALAIAVGILNYLRVAG